MAHIVQTRTLTPEFIHKVDRIVAGFEKGAYSPFLCAQDVPSSINGARGNVSGDQPSVDVQTSFTGTRSPCS